MALPPYLLIPFGTALVYALATVVLKRALNHRVSPWLVAFVSNWTMTLLYLPLYFFGASVGTPVQFGHAALAAVTFFVGQIFTFLALGRGDVSVATPLLGTKVIFVALLTKRCAVARPRPLVPSGLGGLSLQPLGHDHARRVRSIAAPARRFERDPPAPSAGPNAAITRSAALRSDRGGMLSRRDRARTRFRRRRRIRS
jgi:uncharacterized membrane protein